MRRPRERRGIQIEGVGGSLVHGQRQRLGHVDLAGCMLTGGGMEVAQHLAADAITIVGRKRRKRHGAPRLAAIRASV